MKIRHLLLLLISAGSFQNGAAAKMNWTSDPFNHNRFIENKGQFDARAKGGAVILFSAQLGRVHAYFTPNGVIYRYDEVRKHGENEKEEKEREEKPETETYFVSMTWENTSPDSKLMAEGKQRDYYTYSENGRAVSAALYHKLIYKNIYKGIDIEYFFPEDKEGIKYNIIVHPGADHSQVKFSYSGIRNMKLDQNGDLLISARMGDFTEHAPVAFADGMKTASSYIVSGTSVSFACPAGPFVQQLVIDPWVSNPLFGNVNRAIDVDFDDAGNVYAYGSSQPFQLVKFNSAGTKLWTYNVPQASSTIDYGCFAVDKVSGSCYVFHGWVFATNPAKIFKVSTTGTLLKQMVTPYPLEFWRAKFDRCHHQFIVASGGWNNPNAQVSVVDTNLNGVQTYNPLGIQGCCFDAALLAIDPSGTDFYLGMVNGTGNIYTYPYNSLTKLPLSSPGTAAYIRNSGYHFSECAITWSGVQQCGFNGIAAGPGALYLYDGSTLKKFDKNTGTVLATNVVNTPQYTFWQNNNPYLDTTIVTHWGGLDADMCDNVYAGDHSSIQVYNSSLALINSMPLPDTVYDVKLHHDFQRIYACGQGFVACLQLPPPALSVTAANSSNCACTGTATAGLNSCTTSGVQYLWNNGQTTQTATGLCPGSYTVDVTLQGPACTTIKMNFTDSVTVQGGGSLLASAGNATICAGQSATLAASGGTNYSWNTGASISSISVSPTATTTYSVIVSIGNCNDTAIATVTVGPPFPLSLSGNTTVCTGGTVTLTASGGSGYVWSTGATTSSIQVVPAGPATYSVVSTNSAGCTSAAAATVNALPPPVAAVSPVTVCAGQTAVLTASGGTSYSWNTGATSASVTVTPSATSFYSVVVSIGSCSDTAQASVSVTPSPQAALGADETVCSGSTVVLDAGNPGANYLWSTGATTQSVVAAAPGSYWVVVGAGNCLAVDSITAFIAPSVHLFDSSLCTTTPILLDPGPGASSYLWSNGSTQQSISVDVSGSYWVQVVFGNCISSDTARITGDGNSGSLYVPSAFTPNGDNLNETFAPKGTGIVAFSMNIFDRWGNMVFDSDQMEPGWNGKVEGGHYLMKRDGKEMVQEDIYIWKISYSTGCFPDLVKKEMGSVAVIK